MKASCERCGRGLEGASVAYICSFECTFCSRCRRELVGHCPNCGGELVRRPRRGRVHADIDELEATGLQRATVAAAAGYIEEHLAEALTLRDIAAAVHTSPPHLSRLFRTVKGRPPHRYVLERRLERAKRLLSGTTLSVGQVAHEAGFASASHFAETFRRRLGLTPSCFRHPAKGCQETDVA